MFKTVRNENKEAISILEYEAKNALEKRLKKQQKKVDNISLKLRDAYDKNSSMKKRSNLRVNLSLECEELDRIKKAIELLNYFK